MGRSGADLGARQDDIKTLYTTSNWPTALAIIGRYNIQYIYIGSLERSTYPCRRKSSSPTSRRSFIKALSPSMLSINLRVMADCQP